MHSLIVSSLSGLLLLLPVVGIQLSMLSVAVVLAVAVAVVGLPHGGLDHRVGKHVLHSLASTSSTFVFVCGYLSVSILVVAAWFVSPLTTIVAFFCLSAWHFGLEEDERDTRTAWQWAGMVARGGMVIWIPAVFQGAEIARLLSTIAPSETELMATQIVSVIQFGCPFCSR